MIALILPTTAYAGKPDVISNATNVEIVKKIGVKGMPLMGPPSSGLKPYAATGILGKPLPEGGKRYAIIVGISDYPGDKHVLDGGYDLSYSDEDAVEMKQTLMSIYNFEEANICLLLDTEATRDAILDEIADLEGIVNEDDEVVFFFSGHGAKGTPKPTPAQGGGKVGIVTWGWENPEYATDFYLEVIWDKELKEAFRGFKTDRIVFIFDSCLAGGMIDLGSKGRVICMATTQTGVAAEYGEDYGPPIQGMGPINHGLFTCLLVELGMLYGLADSYPVDGWVTAEEAFDFARFNLQGMSIATPELWQIPTISDRFPKDLLL
jgi:hypothetical protein